MPAIRGSQGLSNPARHQGNVLSAETKAIRGGDVALGLAGRVGDIVEVALGIGCFVVDGGGEHFVLHRHQADNQLRRPGGGDQMARHALGARDRKLVGMRAEHLADR